MAETNPMTQPGRPAGRLLGPIVSPPGSHAPFAARPQTSRGRFYPETESPTRSCYSRDRDRIIHSSAFRRMKHKTQVFVQHEGDYYRTRLTHSLEVAQLARSLARTLACDEDLAETVALAHDLGHTPFGHAGEEALDAVTRDIGGFDHNAHTLRLVTKLEHRYADFDGLNLTWETLEGLVKHNGPLLGAPLRFQLPLGSQRSPSPAETTSPSGALRAEGEEGLCGQQRAALPGPIASFDARWPLELATWPGLEAQLAALADDIAYLNHDLDDGLRAGLVTIDELAEAPLAGDHVKGVIARHGRPELSRFIGELIRTLMSALIEDVLAETRARLADGDFADAPALRGAGRATAAFSPAMAERLKALKAFQAEHIYRHPHVAHSMGKAKVVVGELFAAFSGTPLLLPPDWSAACGAPGDAATGSVVRDYIAGMTDSYALAEYRRIFHRQVDV